MTGKRRPISACEPASSGVANRRQRRPCASKQKSTDVSQYIWCTYPYTYTHEYECTDTDFRNPTHHICQELHLLLHVETRRGLWRWFIVVYFSSRSTHFPSLSIERKKTHLLYSACTQGTQLETPMKFHKVTYSLTCRITFLLWPTRRDIEIYSVVW